MASPPQCANTLEMVFLRDEADGFYQLVNMFKLEMDEGEEPLYGYSSKAFLPQDSQPTAKPNRVLSISQQLHAESLA